MRGIVAGVLICIYVFGALSTIATVGKPRKPLTGGIAAGTVAVAAIICVGVYWLWASA